MEKYLKKGLFVTFEGPEGSGKSTHSRRLEAELLQDGYNVFHTAEPGGTKLGKAIREILLEKENINLSSYAELFLFEADRAQHVNEVILPALEENKIVLCDRFNTATFAYQGYGLGMPIDLIEKIDEAATGGVEADLVMLLDIDVEKGMVRALGTGDADRMEKRDKEFHERVRSGYITLSLASEQKIKKIDASGGIEEVYREIKDEVYGLIGQNTVSG